MTSLATKARDMHYKHSKAHGQNTRVRTVFLTLTKIFDLLVFFIRCSRKKNLKQGKISDFSILCARKYMMNQVPKSEIELDKCTLSFMSVILV